MDLDAGAVAARLDGRVGAPVARNTIVLSGAQAATLLLHLVWFAVLSAHLGPSALGVYVFAVAVPNLLGPIVDFGFTAMAAREVAREPSLEPYVVPNLFYLRLAWSLVCLAGTIAFLHLAGYRPLTVRAASVAALITVVMALQSLQVSLQVRLRMAWVAAGNLLEALILVAGVEWLVQHRGGLMAFVWLYLLANAVSLVTAAYRALALAGYRWRLRPDLLRPIVSAALPLGAAGVVTSLYYNLVVLVLARFHSSAAVGQFGAGYRFIDTVSVFPGLLVGLLNPVFARSAAVGLAVLRRRYATVMHLATVPSVMLAVGGAMTAWRALPALHAFRHYHGGGVVLALLAPAAGLILLGSVLSGVLFNARQQKLLLVLVVLVLACDAGIDFSVIPLFSYVGAAVATTAGEAVAVAVLALAAARRLRLAWPWDRTRRALGAGLALAAVLGAGYLLPPLVQLAVGLVATPLLVFATGALTLEDLSILRHADTGLAPEPTDPPARGHGHESGGPGQQDEPPAQPDLLSH